MKFLFCVMFIPNMICYDLFERRNTMNQVKIGAFLKELRKQKGLTQEQFVPTHLAGRKARYHGDFPT